MRKGKHGKSKQGRMTLHHRKPRSFGGKKKFNCSKVPEKIHQAYHMLFDRGYPAICVAHILNHTWLAHESVLIPIPTEKLQEVLDILTKEGIALHQKDLGITEMHKRFFKKDCGHF